MKVTVIIPVLARPHRVRPLLESIKASQKQVRLEPLFVVSLKDRDEWRELRRVKAPHLFAGWDPGPGDYARKINYAINETNTDWILAAADDLNFLPGWADEAVRVAEQTGRRFIGTNDRANPIVMRGRHATHPLVHRSYITELGTIDEPGKLYHEGYSHQCIDNEATQTAMFRNEFEFAQMSIVEHLHPIYPRPGEARVPMDDTYRKGMADGKNDLRLLKSREHLWLRGRARRARQ